MLVDSDESDTEVEEEEEEKPLKDLVEACKYGWVQLDDGWGGTSDLGCSHSKPAVSWK